MQGFLSPSGPPRLAPGSHSHPGFVCQAPGCPLPVQASKATTSIQGYNQPTCAPYLSYKVRSRGWGGRGDLAPMSAKHLLRK